MRDLKENGLLVISKMLNRLKFFLNHFPALKNLFRKIYFFLSSKADLTYPRAAQKDVTEIKRVLYDGNWNLTYSPGGAHTRLEKAVADYINVSDAIAVNTGGMALQLIFRALNLSP